MESTATPQAGSSRYLVLVGAIVVQLILGTVYGYSIFWEPLESKVFPEVRTEAQAEQILAEGGNPDDYTIVADEAAAKTQQDVQRGYLKYAFSICILTFAIVMVVAGRVQDIKGPRFTAIIGAVLMGGGFILAGSTDHFIVFYVAHALFIGLVCIGLLMVYHALFGKLDMEEMPILKYIPMGIMTCAIVTGVLLGNRYVGNLGPVDKLFMLWGTVGFLAGAGIGFAYVCPIAALIKWFPEKKGLVSGLAVAGFGFGAYIFKGDAIGATGYIQENGIQSFFIVHGLICLVGIIIGAMLLRNPPGTAPKAAIDSNWQDTLKRPAFYVLWLMFFSGAMAGLMVIGILKGFAGEQLVEAAKAQGGEFDKAALLLKGAEAVGWLAIFNAAGRVFWGFASDKISRTGAFVVMFIFQAVMMFILGQMNTEISLAVGASIVGFNFGGNFALFPSATADFFGARNLGANYGWVFTSYGIAGVVGIAAGNAAKVQTGSYEMAFTLAAVLCLISAGLAIGLKVAQKRQAA